MIELIEKTLLAGIGALSLTQQKTEELVREFQQQLNLSEEKGNELLKKLRQAAEENQKKLEELAQEEVRRSCERLGVVTRDDFDKLQKKVLQLEKKLKELSS